MSVSVSVSGRPLRTQPKVDTTIFATTVSYTAAGARTGILTSSALQRGASCQPTDGCGEVSTPSLPPTLRPSLDRTPRFHPALSFVPAVEIIETEGTTGRSMPGSSLCAKATVHAGEHDTKSAMAHQTCRPIAPTKRPRRRRNREQDTPSH